MTIQEIEALSSPEFLARISAALSSGEKHLTNKGIAKILGVREGTVESWRASPDKPWARPMPRNERVLLALVTGIFSITDLLLGGHPERKRNNIYEDDVKKLALDYYIANPDVPVLEMARLFGINKSTLTNWIRGSGEAGRRTPGGMRRKRTDAIVLATYKPGLTIKRTAELAGLSESGVRASLIRNGLHATRSQGEYMKANASKLTAFGETKSISDWAQDAKSCGSDIVIRDRLRLGWDVEAAIATPVRARRKNQ